jgi:hypothetical protein
MGRFVGAGGWIGPGSRHASWVTRRWWHQAITDAVIVTLMMFPIRYLGLVIDTTRHQLVPSLIGAVYFGVGLGLMRAGMEAWSRRTAERNED